MGVEDGPLAGHMRPEDALEPLGISEGGCLSLGALRGAAIASSDGLLLNRTVGIIDKRWVLRILGLKVVELAQCKLIRNDCPNGDVARGKPLAGSLEHHLKVLAVAGQDKDCLPWAVLSGPPRNGVLALVGDPLCTFLGGAGVTTATSVPPA